MPPGTPSHKESCADVIFDPVIHFFGKAVVAGLAHNERLEKVMLMIGQGVRVRPGIDLRSGIPVESVDVLAMRPDRVDPLLCENSVQVASKACRLRCPTCAWGKVEPANSRAKSPTAT